MEPILLILVGFGISFVLGKMGNDFWENRLKDDGYDFKGMQTAPTQTGQ